MTVSCRRDSGYSGYKWSSRWQKSTKRRFVKGKPQVILCCQMNCRMKAICQSLHRKCVRRYRPLWTWLRKVFKSIVRFPNPLSSQLGIRLANPRQCQSGFRFLHRILFHFCYEWERGVIENGCFLFSDCECGIRFRAPIKLIPRWIFLQPFPMTLPCKGHQTGLMEIEKKKIVSRICHQKVPIKPAGLKWEHIFSQAERRGNDLKGQKLS